MPYRHAHLAVWFLIGLTVVAFWPGYLSRLGRSQWQHHFHGLTALAWMLAPTWLVGGLGLGMGATAMGLGWMAPFASAPWLEPLPETDLVVRLRAAHDRGDLPACGATPSSAPASSVARAVTCVRSSRPTASHVACDGTSAATRPRHRLEVR